MNKKKKNVKTHSKSKTSHKKKEQMISSPISKEIVGICIIGVSLLVLLGMFSEQSGLFGEILRNVFVGLMGIGGYIIPVAAIVIGVFYIQGHLEKVYKLSVYIASLVVILITLFHVMYYGEQLTESLFSTYYMNEGAWLNGGFIGALLGHGLLKLLGLYGGYVVLSALLLIWVLMVTQFPLISWLNEQLSHLLEGLRFEIKRLKSHPKKAKRSKSKKIRVGKDLGNTEGMQLLEPEDDLSEVVDIPIEIYDAASYDHTRQEIGEYKEEAAAHQEVSFYDSLEMEDVQAAEEEQHVMHSTPRESAYGTSHHEQTKTEVPTQRESTNLTMRTSEHTQAPVRPYEFPSINLLNKVQTVQNRDASKRSLSNAKKLEETLGSFGVEAKVTQIHRGPSVTRYELQPKQGVKVSKIVNLSDDIALNLAAPSIRIEAPIPGKAAVGIEVANESSEIVYLRDVIESDNFLAFPSKLAFALGKDIAGKPIIADIGKMPHILIAGATGSGKSVCINTLITSILYKAKPSEVRLIMIDPKVVELSVYNGIPHLLIPVVTDPKKAAGALFWAVNEMTRRYNLFAENNVRDMKGYNSKQTEEIEKMPQIVIIIDELADLMMTGAKEVEDAICRLAQMARAAGIHLVIATQRPSVDVITGVIKANIPSRLAFAVSSGTDSRTILDSTGAEKLLGKGDMLFYPVGESKPIRIQGAFISDKEVESIVNAVKMEEASYETSMIESLENIGTSTTDDHSDEDELVSQAIEFAKDKEKLSISMLQRYFRIGFNRAARLMDALEARGIVGPDEGSKPRRVL